MFVYAYPSSDKRAIGDDCLYSTYNQQEAFYAKKKKYEEVHSRWYKGVMCKAERYLHADGWGYVATAGIVEDGKLWIKQQHVGPDNSLVIASDWTRKETW